MKTVNIGRNHTFISCLSQIYGLNENKFAFRVKVVRKKRKTGLRKWPRQGIKNTMWNRKTSERTYTKAVNPFHVSFT